MIVRKYVTSKVNSFIFAGSPNRNYQDNPGGLEAASSPTSSTASESRSPPSVRKRSHSRKGKFFIIYFVNTSVCFGVTE